ncbi:MAG TPA: tetratricopeptide repeat protein [Cyclobacteriaceae bacterium]
MNNRGLAKRNIGDNKGAYEDYNAAIAIDSTMVEAFGNRANAYFADEMYKEAAGDYLKSIRLNPEGISYYRHALCLVQIDRPNDALVEYRKAKSMGMSTAGFYNHVGVAHYKLGNYDSAATLFKKAMDLDKESCNMLRTMEGHCMRSRIINRPPNSSNIT